MIIRKLLIAITLIGGSTAAYAGNVDGKIVRVEGRMNNECAYVAVRKSDNSLMYLRVLPGTASNSIVSVALTALTTQLPVTIQYSPGSACGGDQAIDIIGALAP